MEPARPRIPASSWLEPLGSAMFLGLALTFNRGAAWPWWWLIDLVTVSGSALSYRRPVLGACLTALGLLAWIPFASPPASISALAVFISIFAAARREHTLRVPITVVLFGLSMFTLVYLPASETFGVDSVILLMIMLTLSWGAGVLWRDSQRQMEISKLTAERDLSRLRISLARDLHDTVAQTLSGAAMRANLVAMDCNITSQSLNQLDRIVDECGSSAHDLRELLSSLSLRHGQVETGVSPLTDQDSLSSVLDVQADRIRSHGMEVMTSMAVEHLSRARAETLSAVVTEAASNVIKHAKRASTCSFRIFETETETVGEVENVPAHTITQSHGMGLTGVQERLALLHGRCEVESSPERWLLRIVLPHGIPPLSSRSKR